MSIISWISGKNTDTPENILGDNMYSTEAFINSDHCVGEISCIDASKYMINVNEASRRAAIEDKKRAADFIDKATILADMARHSHLIMDSLNEWLVNASTNGQNGVRVYDWLVESIVIDSDKISMVHGMFNKFILGTDIDRIAMEQAVLGMIIVDLGYSIVEATVRVSLFNDPVITTVQWVVPGIEMCSEGIFTGELLSLSPVKQCYMCRQEELKSVQAKCDEFMAKKRKDSAKEKSV